MSTRTYSATFLKLFLFIVLLAFLNEAALAEKHVDYQVKGNKVDSATFIGWQAYHQACVSCHGVDAAGTDVAPDLTQSVERLSVKQFELKVLHKKIIRFTGDDWRLMEQAMMEEILKQEKRDKGELAKMPRWEYNPAIKANVSNIYRYLKARADGALGPGKPGILKN